jgi:hypothetical protein
MFGRFCRILIATRVPDRERISTTFRTTATQMTRYRFGFALAVASITAVPFHHNDATQPSINGAPACATDSNYQRLAFWIGDWEVVDSTGAHYANQRIHTVVDGCAFVAEWTGRVGDKGMSVSAFDERAGMWKQVYVSNQVPGPSGVPVRRSDPSYAGPGIRFIPLIESSPDQPSRSRVTILPWTDGRVLQLFEDSSDGGKTWRTVFKAEHRKRTGGS